MDIFWSPQSRLVERLNFCSNTFVSSFNRSVKAAKKVVKINTRQECFCKKWERSKSNDSTFLGASRFSFCSVEAWPFASLCLQHAGTFDKFFLPKKWSNHVLHTVCPTFQSFCSKGFELLTSQSFMAFIKGTHTFRSLTTDFLFILSSQLTLFKDFMSLLDFDGCLSKTPNEHFLKIDVAFFTSNDWRALARSFIFISIFTLFFTFLLS